MEKITREEFVKEFNSVMRLLKDRTSFLDNDLEWSSEDLEAIGQERVQDISRLLTRLNVLVTTPFKENEEI